MRLELLKQLLAVVACSFREERSVAFPSAFVTEDCEGLGGHGWLVARGFGPG